ncbi:MAG: amidase [Bacteroidales bacterium]|nr:amidase [Bacteroidales bacterium]MDZ4203347.1 amidase [Bacteroidales bacterium]
MNYTSRCELGEFTDNLVADDDSLKRRLIQLCEKLDEIDPVIQSFLPEINRQERLFLDAKELFQRFPDTNNCPPLFGIPVGIKDIFRIDGWPTQAGSQLPAELFEGEEAWVVTRLKSLGALILGKTVSTEFAFFEPGPTRNPFNIGHTPGGSSSGSAAAVAAGFAPLAIGSQTIGSIGRPASYCGVFGFKPSFGRIPTDGIIHFSVSADHVGFFTQDMKGVQVAAKTLIPDWKTQEFLSKKPVLAIPDGPYLVQAEPEMLVFFNNKISQLKTAGFSIKHIQTFGNIEQINSMHRSMIAAEFAWVHNNWYDSYHEKYRPQSASLVLEGRSISDVSVAEYRNYRLELREELEQTKSKNQFDLWVTPSAMGAAPIGHASTGSPLMNLPWTMAGLPVLSAPMGRDISNLPLGIQFIGSFGEDELMLDRLNFLRQFFQTI